MLSRPGASLTTTHSSDVFTSDEAAHSFVAYHPPSIGCAPSRIHARALSSPNSRENAQNRWAHLEPFNLGFALKIVQRCPIYTLQNPPLCAFPDNPWNIEYSILQKNPLMSQCSFVPADPWSPLFWKFSGVVFFIIVRSGKNPATLFVAKSVRCEPGPPLVGFLRYFGNTHFNPSSIWYPHFYPKKTG